MNYRGKFLAILCAVICLSALAAVSLARDDDDDQPTTNPASVAPGDVRFGAFDWLDKRSAYYTDAFPEPFRVDDTTVEQELRFDWQHAEAKGAVADQFLAELQHSVGIVTFELQASYNTNSSVGDSEDVLHEYGIGSIELGARLPVYQFVSPAKSLDNTIGLNLEVGIPSNAPQSKNTEITPGVFDDLLIGQFSVQSLVGLSSLFGSEPDDGRESLEYGIAFGYSIERDDFALPYVERTTPIIEFVGETALSNPDPGHNALTATTGIRFELKSIGPIQPQIGLAYFFPLDEGGREELRWGTIVSLDFEF